MFQGNDRRSLLSLPKTLWKLSITLAALITIFPPLGYWIISLQNESNQLKQSAELISHAISKQAFLHPDNWDLQVHRLEHLVEEFRPRNPDLVVTVWDNTGYSLLPTEVQQLSLSISRDASIRNNDGVVGKVTLETSLVHTAQIVTTIGLTCLVVAFGFLGIINRYSIRGIQRALSEIERAHRELQQQRMYLDGILTSSENVAIIATDKKWIIQYFNQAAEKLFQCTQKDVLGSLLYELHDELRGKIGEIKQSRQMEDEEYNFMIRENSDTQERHIEARLSSINDNQRGLSGYTLICTDVTIQHQTSELIQYQATYDNLTGLPNRRLLTELLDKAIARGKRHGHLGAVLFLDLDNFKHINDALGHSIGDMLLQEVAVRMKSCLRDEDTVARLGGDEFVVVLPEVSDDAEDAINSVQELANKIRKILSVPYVIEPNTLHITTSIGISIFPNNEKEGPDDVMRQADTAMYRAKESGRNATKFFLPSMQLAADERLKILGDLRQGVDRTELLAFFQPQFDARQIMIGAEALIRWQHPEKGLVLPHEFIPVAEESALILEIGDYILEAALGWLRKCLSEGKISRAFRVSVNISPPQFKQANFVHKIEHAIANAGVEPTNLTLELTEGVLLDDIESAIPKILRLKKIGVRFSIDDFGTGYSSLSYLKRLPVDEIKIDRSFVSDILQNDSDAALVETILNLASRLDLDTVAEGVETDEQYEFLKQLGCNVYQGYLFGKPLPPEDFQSFFTP